MVALELDQNTQSSQAESQIFLFKTKTKISKVIHSIRTQTFVIKPIHLANNILLL